VTTSLDLTTLDYEGKVRALEEIARQCNDLRQEYAQVSGRCAELRAELMVLGGVRGALQSALRAERDGA
jgi:hypothetical protein